MEDQTFLTEEVKSLRKIYDEFIIKYKMVQKSVKKDYRKYKKNKINIIKN
jgi:hypothetical protein